MALVHAIQGSRRPSQMITWLRDDENETAEDLTGATLSGIIQREGETTGVAITGTLSVTDGEAGEFRWDYSTDDVAVAGMHRVQFSAAFGDNPTPAKTMVSAWMVKASLAVAD